MIFTSASKKKTSIAVANRLIPMLQSHTTISSIFIFYTVCVNVMHFAVQTNIAITHFSVILSDTTVVRDGVHSVILFHACLMCEPFNHPDNINTNPVNAC